MVVVLFVVVRFVAKRFVDVAFVLVLFTEVSNESVDEAVEIKPAVSLIAVDVAAVTSAPNVPAVKGYENVEQVAQVSVSEPPRATEPPPARGPVVLTVSELF